MKHIKIFEDFTNNYIKGEGSPGGFSLGEIDRLLTAYIDKTMSSEQVVAELEQYHNSYKNQSGRKFDTTYEDLTQEYADAIEYVKNGDIDNAKAVLVPSQFSFGEIHRHIGGYLTGKMTKEESVEGLQSYYDLYKKEYMEDKRAQRFGKDVITIAKEYFDAIKYVREN